MRRLVLLLVCALTLGMFAAEERSGFRFWERLSLSFDEFAIEADGTLRGSLNGFTDCGFYMKVAGCTSYISSRHRPFALQPGEELTFWRSASPFSSICALAGDCSLIKEMGLPSEMRGESRYLRIRTRGLEVFVGAESQKAYIPKEKACVDFPLPFKSVWTDQKDYDLWVSGGGFRPRFDKVQKISEGEKRIAADLFGYFSSTNLLGLVGDSYAGGVTNVQVDAVDVPSQMVPGVVDTLVVQIAGSTSHPQVSGFSFVTRDGGCRHARRQRFDSQGRFVCGRRIDRENGPGAPDRVVLDMSFTYDAEGVLCRAWTPGMNPLMIDKGNKLYFTGDRDLVVEYRQEVHRALDGLPRLK